MSDLTHRELAEHIEQVHLHLNKRIDSLETRFNLFEDRIQEDIHKIEENTQPIQDIVSALSGIRTVAMWLGGVAGAVMTLIAFLEYVK